MATEELKIALEHLKYFKDAYRILLKKVDPATKEALCNIAHVETIEELIQENEKFFDDNSERLENSFKYIDILVDKNVDLGRLKSCKRVHEYNQNKIIDTLTAREFQALKKFVRGKK